MIFSKNSAKDTLGTRLISVVGGGDGGNPSQDESTSKNSRSFGLTSFFKVVFEKKKMDVDETVHNPIDNNHGDFDEIQTYNDKNIRPDSSSSQVESKIDDNVILENDADNNARNLSSSKSARDDIPDDLTSPIGFLIYREPVTIVQCGAVIERDEVNMLASKLPIGCPAGRGIMLTRIDWVPATNVKKAVERYIADRKKQGNPINPDEQYPEYEKTVAPTAPVLQDIAGVPFPGNNNNDCKGPAVCLLLTGGIAVGLYYLSVAGPCYDQAWNNFTGDPWSFTYDDTIYPNYDAPGETTSCKINPWQNVSSNSTVYLDRWTRQHCTFYLTNGIKIHTTAYTTSVSGEDSNGCSIKVKRGNARCTSDFFKSCPKTVEEAAAAIQSRWIGLPKESEQTNYLQRRP